MKNNVNVVRVKGIKRAKEFFPLAKQFFDESDYKDVPVNWHKVEATIDFMSKDENSILLGCYDKNKEPIGFLAGNLFNPWYSDDLHAQELVVFVTKDKRAIGAGAQLYNEFIDWAEKQNAKRVIISTTTKINEAGFDRLAKRLELERTGLVYAKKF